MCRVMEVPLSWTLVTCPCCPLCPEAIDRAASRPCAAGTAGAVQSVGAEQKLAATQSPPRARQSPQGPQGQQRWLGWMGCHGNPARSCICHQGGQIANRQVARYPRGGVASRVSSAADNLGQCGGERNEGDLGAAPQSGWALLQLCNAQGCHCGLAMCLFTLLSTRGPLNCSRGM